MPISWDLDDLIVFLDCPRRDNPDRLWLEECPWAPALGQSRFYRDSRMIFLRSYPLTKEQQPKEPAAEMPVKRLLRLVGDRVADLPRKAKKSYPLMKEVGLKGNEATCHQKSKKHLPRSVGDQVANLSKKARKGCPLTKERLKKTIAEKPMKRLLGLVSDRAANLSKKAGQASRSAWNRQSCWVVEKIQGASCFCMKPASRQLLSCKIHP